MMDACARNINELIDVLLDNFIAFNAVDGFEPFRPLNLVFCLNFSNKFFWEWRLRTCGPE
jgi:hypothetical protein